MCLFLKHLREVFGTYLVGFGDVFQTCLGGCWDMLERFLFWEVVGNVFGIGTCLEDVGDHFGMSVDGFQLQQVFQTIFRPQFFGYIFH